MIPEMCFETYGELTNKEIDVVESKRGQLPVHRETGESLQTRCC